MTEQVVPQRTRESAQRFNVRDGQRPITFVGWSLARADSQSGADVRWTELTLYTTLTGKYIVEKIGRSDVFHTVNCARGNKAKLFDSLADARPADADEADGVEDLFVPCDVCGPAHDVAPVLVERDIFSISIYETPKDAIESLHRRDGDTVRPLSRVARALLDEAERNDTGIASALRTPSDIT